MSESKWYILHTYSGYENKVATNIMKLVENRNLGHLVEDVMIPTETVVEERENGEKHEYESKLFPSYVYVKMVLTDETWYICRNTRGVTGFVGPDSSTPIPLTDEEVANLKFETKVSEVKFKKGDRIRIKSGSLNGVEGVVDDIDEAAGTVSVTVSMFGRYTPATLDISEVEKIEY